MNDFLTTWSSDTKELLEKQAHLMLKNLKNNCSTYGELNQLAHNVKMSVLFHKKNQVLEPVFDILFQFIEIEKNALSIKEGIK